MAKYLSGVESLTLSNAHKICLKIIELYSEWKKWCCLVSNYTVNKGFIRALDSVAS